MTIAAPSPHGGSKKGASKTIGYRTSSAAGGTLERIKV